MARVKRLQIRKHIGRLSRRRARARRRNATTTASHEAALARERGAACDAAYPMVAKESQPKLKHWLQADIERLRMMLVSENTGAEHLA